MSNRPFSRFRKSALRILGFAIGAGILYPLLDGENLVGMLNGLLVGLFGGLFIIYFELNYNNPLHHKMKFVKKVILKTLAYTGYFAILIPLVIVFDRSIDVDKSFIDYLFDDFVKNYIIGGTLFTRLLYTLVLCGAVIFIHQLSLKMGQGVLWNFITGKYHLAKEEERIFMFLDLNNSTFIAEKLGKIEYNEFLSMFFFDITNSILKTYGEIYRYVGDEVVVTWPIKKGLKNANCIRTFFLAQQAIRKEREKYLVHYGLIPEFTAGYHCGKVIVGEIGDVKSQIVFSGDVLYVTTAIEKQCRQLKSSILVSEYISNHISLPVIYNMTQAGEIISETGQKISLFKVEETELASS